MATTPAAWRRVPSHLTHLMEPVLGLGGLFQPPLQHHHLRLLQCQLYLRRACARAAPRNRCIAAYGTRRATEECHGQ